MSPTTSPHTQRVHVGFLDARGAHYLLLSPRPHTRLPGGALTLRAVGGLTTREIADAFNVPEATMAQRISRAKRTLQGRRLDQSGDLAVVLRVLRGVRASAGAAWGNSVSITGEFRRAPSCDGAPITQRHRPPASSALRQRNRALKDAGGVPGYGNQRSELNAGTRFDWENPEYRS